MLGTSLPCWTSAACGCAGGVSGALLLECILHGRLVIVQILPCTAGHTVAPLLLCMLCLMCGILHRYWLADSYGARHAAGEEPQNIDKEFLRLWFRDNCDPYTDEVRHPCVPQHPCPTAVPGNAVGCACSVLVC